MKPRKVPAAATAVLMLALAATACGSGGGSDDGKKVTVGIKFDQPGVGLKTPDGDYEGFDVDVARYVAGQLGYAPSDIVFKEAKSADRETLLQRGDVDFIVASYSINDERRTKVDFAGPYFLAHQDVLVRAGDDSITSPADLNGRKLCSVTGSTSAQNVKNELAPRAQLQEYGGYSECLTGLENGTIDAVTTDDAILAGYAAQDHFKGKFRLGGFELSDELYGIGVKKGDTELRSDIDTALRKMVLDSAWQRAVEANFGPAGYRSEPPPGIGAPAAETPAG
ncbi:glutamate ABC transporter substrate-binding protein [Streptomyces pacificus]|uniref:Glutamate ABC transporter substrate-binding protein n=1 Tax=Streptomyces pacificus TaxID=2705029 RepID=A0A6A0ASQ4_9ACTN|nr:glutamate ABC transporter substrate-binding protein [Streptomyces pacificus]GFH34617.1 glutamate ABC transporter substrate-binding protein [Streptomyces pacificus]